MSQLNMSRTLVFVFLMFVGLNCQRPRIRLPGEIVPVSVEKSRTTDTGTGDGSAAVDLDFSTRASAKGTKNSTAWLKLTFDKLYCISLVNRFNADATVRQSYTCTNDSCHCSGEGCPFMEELSVESDREDTKTLPVMPLCKYGSSVTLQLKSGVTFNFGVHELAVFGISVAYTENSVSTDGSTSCISCPPGNTVNKTKFDGSFLRAIPEPILWSILTLLILICTTLVILLARKCSYGSCCCCHTAEPDDEPGYINNEVASLALTSINKDLQQAPNIDNTALKSAGNTDNAALKSAGNTDNAALKPSCALLQVPTLPPSTPAPTCTVQGSFSSPEPDYINTSDLVIYEELN